MSGSLQLGFVQQYYPYAASVATSTGLPVDFVLAQSALETGYGTSNAAVNRNNFFGLSPGGSLANFGSVGDSFSYYADLVKRKFSGFTGMASSQIGDYFQSSGYATDPQYGSKIKSILPGINSALTALGLPSIGAGSSQSEPTGISGAIDRFTSSITDTLKRGGVIVLALILIALGLWALLARQNITLQTVTGKG